MIIKLPAFCGSRTHKFLLQKADKAIELCENIEFDCNDAIFTTDGFLRFLINVHKRTAAFNSNSDKKQISISLFNVSDNLFDILKTCNIDGWWNIVRKQNGRKPKFKNSSN